MIDVQNLQVRKGSRVICSVTDFSVKTGEHVAVVGANGAGKSTLLRVLAGIELRYEGKVDVDCSQLDRVLVHQTPLLFRGTVESNVRYGLRARGIALSEADKRAGDLIERFGLESIRSSPVANLSGGERRRVALAQALVLRPALLLLDEPASDLDCEARCRLQNVFSCEPDMTIIVAAPEVESTLLENRRCYRLASAFESRSSSSS